MPNDDTEEAIGAYAASGSGTGAIGQAEEAIDANDTPGLLVDEASVQPTAAEQEDEGNRDVDDQPRKEELLVKHKVKNEDERRIVETRATLLTNRNQKQWLRRKKKQPRIEQNSSTPE